MEVPSHRDEEQELRRGHVVAAPRQVGDSASPADTPAMAFQSPGSAARRMDTGGSAELLCVPVLESDINEWSDHVRQRIQLAEPEVFDGSMAGLQVYDPAKHAGREAKPLQHYLLHHVPRPAEGLGSLTGALRDAYLGADGELKQVGMRNTHMTAKLIVGLNHKLECKMVERVAMRQLAHRLSTLVLEDCCIQDDDLGYIAAGLCRVIGSDTVCKLRCLSLTNNFISAKGGQSLGKALRVSTTLRHLYLDWNNLGAEGCRHLSEALRHNRHLELLHLEANDVRDQGIVELAAALGTNSSLTDVNLATNNITASGGAALARMLHANDALVSLCLNGNSIGGQGGCQVAEALGGGNSRLERLALDSSDLPAECFEALAKSLRTAACRLQHLSASANACGDQGARALAYSLSSNTRLRTLRLAGAGISRDCVAAIIDVAASVGRLEELDLRGNAGVEQSMYLKIRHQSTRRPDR